MHNRSRWPCGASARRFWGIGWLALALIAGGCDKPASTLAPRTPTIVSVSAPLEREIVDQATFTGTTDAFSSVEIRARVSGYLQKVAFDAGTIVKEGTLLYEIDPRPYQADLEQAQAQLASAEAGVQRRSADLSRAEKLRTTNTISAEEFDRTLSEQKEAAASVLNAKAHVDRAKLNLEFTRISAPLTGRVNRTAITEGNLVSADTTLLTTIVSVTPMYVYFDVDERTLLELKRESSPPPQPAKSFANIKVEMSLADETGFPHQGRLDAADNRLDQGTGTLRIRAVFDNQDNALTAGLFARVRVPVSDPYKALLITERAVTTDQGQKMLLLVNEQNEVVPRFVKLGEKHDQLRVVTEGLKPTDRVIVNGLQRVRPGVKVDPKPIDMLSVAGSSDASAAAGAQNAPAAPVAPAAPTPSAPAKK